MIPFNFAYFKPSNIEDAMTHYKELTADGNKVYFYNGGTEFISRARRNEITCDAVIDIKTIPETNELDMAGDELIMGASCTLSSLINDGAFPLLAHVAKGIATQTERNKITLGGNIASNLPYKEAILPFLLSDSEVVIAGKKGIKQHPINDMYQNGTLIKEGEFIVQFITKRKWTTLPFIHLRKTKQSHINYPIISLAAVTDKSETRIAISGLRDYPFRAVELETIFQKDDLGHLDDTLASLNESTRSDFQASKKYRQFILRTMLEEIQSMKGVS